MSLWSKKEALDEAIFVLENLRNTLRIKAMMRRYPALFARSREITAEVAAATGPRVAVVANGPSSRGITPNSPDLIFLNFGCRHPAFAKAPRPVLVVVDNKLADGGWSLDMLHEAQAINGEVTFALGALLLQSEEVRAFAESERCMIVGNYLTATRYARPSRPFTAGGINYGGAVTEQGMALALALGAKEIDVYGFDGNNVVLGLAGQDTHFYGNDPEKDWTKPDFVARELRFLSFFIDRNRHLARLIEAQGVRVTNHSPTPFMSGMWTK